ncbi:MAG: hypothetical protein BroJett041_23810 [Candidatus Jettenia caeni]|nr:MAG: hypothetical protein BroJett041_23810 [Candidatus Jettenia caeni]
MKKQPELIEKELLQKGDQLVGIFHDYQYNLRRFPDLNEKKIAAISTAIEDISKGVVTLRSSSIGIMAKDRKLLTYITTHGSSPGGDIVFSVNWKNIVAFKSWRKDEGDDISQDDINTAVYRLAAAISDLMPN